MLLLAVWLGIAWQTAAAPPASTEARLDTLLRRASASLDRAELLGESEEIEPARRDVEEALRLFPDHFVAGKLKVRLLLNKGEWEAALASARALSKKAPDDLDAHGYIVQACRRLNRTADAEKAAQWMLDLRPEDPRSVLAAADLRQDWKQYDGALTILIEVWKRPEAQDRVVRLQLVDRMAKLLAVLNRPQEAAEAEGEAQRIRQEWRKERSLSTVR